MEFSKLSKIGSYLSKEYAEEFFKLLVNYQNISASEAASRLGLHIRTAQDFLEGLANLDILEKKEVHEKKRPYYRYNLAKEKFEFHVDLSQFIKTNINEGLSRLIREIANNHANFSVARAGEYFSMVTIWEGEQRERNEKKISLTIPQGKFLYHLPFPEVRPMSINDIMQKAELNLDYSLEIQDIVDELIRFEIIEVL